MSYLVLARKWRPKTFSDTVGQEHVLQALMNALDSGRLHHAYLFTGTRGVGKTTIARILAKALNCEAGVSAEPCGKCSACQEIDEGRFVDLIEGRCCYQRLKSMIHALCSTTCNTQLPAAAIRCI